jgi:hypothetical protein
MGVLGAETAMTVTSALSEISTLVSTGVSIITGNDVLMILFCGGLMGVGFRIISQAKRAAR